MATHMKRFLLVLLVALLAAEHVACASASNLRRFEGGRKLLYQLNENTFNSKVVAGQEVREARDYGPPGGNPPYHEDPPSPFKMTSVGELKSAETLVDIHVDYAPVTTHPPDYDYPPLDEWSSKTVGSHTDYTPVSTHPPDYDYPPPGVWSSKTVGSHTDYAPATTHRPDYDYPPPGVWSSKTVGSHTDYAPASTHRPDYDYPPPGEWSSKTVGFHTDYAPVTTHTPDYDYPPSARLSSKTAGSHTDYAPSRPDPVSDIVITSLPSSSGAGPSSACSVAQGCSPPS